jgi:hypothetical protein
VACLDPNAPAGFPGIPDINNNGTIAFHKQVLGEDFLYTVTRDGTVTLVDSGVATDPVINDVEEVGYFVEVVFGDIELRRRQALAAPLTIIATEVASFPDPARILLGILKGHPFAIDDTGRVFFQGFGATAGGLLYGSGGPLSVLTDLSTGGLLQVTAAGEMLLVDFSNRLVRRTSGGFETVIQEYPFGLPESDLAGCDVTMGSASICNSDVDTVCLQDDHCPAFPGGGGPGQCNLLGIGVFAWRSGTLGRVAQGDMPMLGSTFQSVVSAFQMNDKGQIFFYALLGDGRTVLVRASPAGASASVPIGPSNAGPPWQFSLTPNGSSGVGGTGFPIFIDPDVAIGYVYTVDPTDPSFASVLVPDPLPNGDDTFQLEFASQTVALMAGEQFDLTSVVTGGVASFTIRGIDPGEGLDPADPFAFVTGLTFTGPDPDVTVTMTAITSSGADGDSDGVTDDQDNCPDAANADQLDVDDDGAGDACDNCRNVQNPEQTDDDNDGFGTLCDPDFDASEFVNVSDLLRFLDAFGKNTGDTSCQDDAGNTPSWCARYDLDGTGSVINTLDLLKVIDSAYFGTSMSGHGCAPADDGIVYCPLP